MTADELQDTAARSAAERDHRKTEQKESVGRDLTKSVAYCRNTDKSLLELKNNKGETALLHAAYERCLAGVRLLFQRGAERAITDSQGNTLLMLIVMKKSYDEIIRNNFVKKAENEELLDLILYGSNNESC